MDKIYEQQFRKERKEKEKSEKEEKEEEKKEKKEESTCGRLARPDGAGSSKKKRKGPSAGEYPDPPFTLRKMTGRTGRTLYELSQKLDALRHSRQKCADGGKVGRRGAAKVLGIDPKTLRGLVT